LALRRARLGPNHPDTMVCLRRLARYYDDLDRYTEALRLGEEVLRGSQEAPHRQTNRRPEAEAINELAWRLANCPDLGLRDPHRAVGLAEEAVKLAQAAPAIWNTLGVARYRAGDWRGAIEALAKSEELGPGTYVGFNAFFLAMAHWKLGQEDESRQWHRRAVQWTEKNRPKDEQLGRFRAEAAALLGLEPRTEREGLNAPADDAIAADPSLQADSYAARARADRSVGQPTVPAMTNGPGAFAWP
jgi:tetratricopeptide (TPR) repeat protein